MRIVQKIQQRLQWSKRRYFTILVLLIVLTYIASAIYHSVKPLPQGLDFAGQSYAADVEFLYDDVQLSAQGQVQGTAQIFPKMLAMVAQAKTTIVLDSFLFNATAGEQQSHYPDQAAQLTAALIQKKRKFPNMNIHIMLDPINTWYGATSAAHLQQLKQAGIDVQYTDLSQLRTPNPMWSAWWYMCCQSLGNSEQGWLNAPWTQDKITVRSYLNLFNLRANHRKVLITDSEQGWHTLISSANIHKGSAYHRNVAFLIHGAFAQDALKSEQVIAQFSGGNVPSLLISPSSQGEATAQLFTEQQIYQRALHMITQAKQGATLDVMMFYLSERKIIQALTEAHQRGVQVRILLDANAQGFGYKKSGIPNQTVASELHQAGVNVRWCAVQQEQCHSKMLMVADGQNAEILLGSANFTARNLKNYNLESDVVVKMPVSHTAYQTAQSFFEQQWQQRSVDYARYANESRWDYWKYRWQEWSGLSSF